MPFSIRTLRIFFRCVFREFRGDFRRQLLFVYLQEKENLDREYRYLTENSADQFVEEATRRILARLEESL